jgi:hypothetical protein
MALGQVVKMKFLALVLLFAITGGCLAFPTVPDETDAIFQHVTQVNVHANATGYYSGTANVFGELLGILYDKGNFTGAGTIVTTMTKPSGVAVDTYNVSPGSAYREPGTKFLTSTDAWSHLSIIAPLTVSMTSGQANGGATVYFIYR